LRNTELEITLNAFITVLVTMKETAIKTPRVMMKKQKRSKELS
jgi:hypothetical protein